MEQMFALGLLAPHRGGVNFCTYNRHVSVGVSRAVTTRTDASTQSFYLSFKKIEKMKAPTGKAVIYEADNGHKYEIAIRKYTPTDCFRLMGVRDDDIRRLLTKHKVIRKGVETEEQIISNSKLYQMAGNSIVTNCMVAMFDELFYPSGKKAVGENGQLLLF